MKNLVRPTTLKVVKKAKDVRINQDRIKEIAREWAKRKIIVPAWPLNFHLRVRNSRLMLDYLIILDSINFCFWNKDKKWQITYKNKKYNGYFALSLALKKFFEENAAKGSLEYFTEISFKEFVSILQGGKDLLFLKKRWQIAKAVSKVLIKKYGDSENFLKTANQKFSVLVSKIYKELPYFNDLAFYKGEKIYFLKRAQILAADIFGAFRGKGIGKFKDLEHLTCFSDYKTPQILHQFGILEYSPNLERKIKNRNTIPRRSNQEIEIRSATVWAVEHLKEELEKLGKKFRSFEIDWILWDMSQKLKIGIPYHLTKTIFY